MGLATITVRSKLTGGIMGKVFLGSNCPPDHRQVKKSLLDKGFNPAQYDNYVEFDPDQTDRYETLIDLFGELNLKTGEYPHIQTLRVESRYPLTDLEVRNHIAKSGYSLESFDYWAVSIPLGVC
jgi:hypothetical protein